MTGPSSAPSEALLSSASEAAQILSESDGILVASGAGLGVDSGLPDYRGRDGFFKAYPVLVRSGILNFEAVDSPSVFETDPRLAWGFYGHRLALYRRTAPGPAFAALARIASALPRGLFAVTSNVDGHHQKAGTPDSRVWEIHGSVHHMQCAAKCSKLVWSADGFFPQVDESTCRPSFCLPSKSAPRLPKFGKTTTACSNWPSSSGDSPRPPPFTAASKAACSEALTCSCAIPPSNSPSAPRKLRK